MRHSLSGTEPFAAETDEEMFVRILRCDYSMTDDVWSFISANAKVRTLLCD